ncbi:protein L-Myc-1b-like [Neosynchiropus ocellatus]
MATSGSVVPHCEIMDYLDQEHFFYDDQERGDDFSRSVAISEDLWKKFELIQTPEVPQGDTMGLLCPSFGDKLEYVSQFLGQDDDQQCVFGEFSPTAMSDLNSFVIQDCMWSCFSAKNKLERIVKDVRERCAKVPRTGVDARAGSLSNITSPWRVPSLNSLGADSVDATSLLASPQMTASRRRLSGSDTLTDTSDDYQPEERKVGRIVLKQKEHNRPHLRTSKPDNNGFQTSIHEEHHNYAATLPKKKIIPAILQRNRFQEKPSTPVKRSPQYHENQPLRHSRGPSYQSNKYLLDARSESPDLGASSSTSSSSVSSPSSAISPSSCPQNLCSTVHIPCSQTSDSDDLDKRKTHNLLERKRRNDLRSRFLLLRDEIPGLVGCSKSSKVAILVQGTAYVNALVAQSKQQANKRARLKARKHQLLKRLQQLKYS